MIEHDCSMNDTLDNFTFQNISCDDKNAAYASNRISFDDSAFLDNVSFEFDQIEPPLEEQQPVAGEINQNGLYGTDYQDYDIDLEVSAEEYNNSNDQGNIHKSDKDSDQSANRPNNNDSCFLSSLKEQETNRLISQSLIQRIKLNSTISIKFNNLKVQPQSNTVLLENGTPHSNLDNQTNPSPTYELSAWNLPDAVLERYEARKVTKMFQWQFECLSNPKVLHGLSNLIYSAPTSAGKTLVAEILALKTIFDRKKKVIFILPFVSIVREKMYYFQDILSSSGIRVEGFMGSYNPPGGFTSVQLAICTIEKANSLINRLLEEERLSEIGAVFVDEMHLLGDPSRGYLLELLLTKLRYISLKDHNIQIQIIGMSATLPNLGQLARWLDSELYSTSFRPIPLYEQASICGELFDNDMKTIRKLESLPELGVDTDHILQLCLETIQESCSVLIFCPTKNWCENLAQQLSQAFFKLGNYQSSLGQLLRAQIRGDLIIEVLEQLKFCPVGLDSILKKTVSFGIAFHHAGLTMDERDIIEGAFRNGAIKVLVATSTLSSGVNLPARRVIIRSPVFGGKPLNLLTYRQMIGRAGRMGKDSKGESILICQKAEYKIAKELMSFELSPVESCLEGAGKLKRAILEVIASGVAISPDDITLFTNCTLMSITKANDPQDQSTANPIDATIEFLKKHEFIRLRKTNGEDEQYVATSLGKACLSSSIAPDEGLTLFTELEKARQCFVLETELHLIYLVTPYSACQTWGNIDWMMYLDFWDKLPSAMKRVGKLVGVSDPFIVSATRGKIDSSSSIGFQKLMVHKRFFVALALQDLVNEVPLATVCAKFNCNRGMLQSLQQSASTFAGMVTAFSKQLGWASVEILFAQFQDRMQFGVSRDLLDLMRLPSLNGKLARILYKAGIETVIELANHDVAYVENVLCRAGPFESAKERDGESKTETNDRNKYRTVWVTGKEGLTEREAAQLLVSDARNYLVIEMGLKEAKWNSQSHSDEHNSTLQLRANKGAIAYSDLQEISEAKLPCNVELNLDASSNFPLSENDNNHKVVSATEDDAFVDGIETSLKTLSITPTKEAENVPTKSPRAFNISESSLFSSPGSLEKSKSTEQLTDSSFSLRLSDDPEVFTETIDEFNSQDDFETAIKNIDISHAIQQNSNHIVGASDTISLSNHSDSSTSSINVLGKRTRSSSGSCSEELFLEATPNKKSKNSKELTSFSSTIKRYSQLSLDNTTSIKALRELHIVDVGKSAVSLQIFVEQLTYRKSFSFWVKSSSKVETKPSIGTNIIKNEKSETPPNYAYFKNTKVDSFSFYWEGTKSYFLSTSNVDFYEKMIKVLRSIFTNQQNSIRLFDAKKQIKILAQCCGVDFCCKIEDPKIADWLLDPEGKEKSFQSMLNAYCKNVVDVERFYQKNGTIGDYNVNEKSAEEAKRRASIKVLGTWHLVDVITKMLDTKMPKINTINVIGFPTNYDLEMRTILCLARMEISGTSVSKKYLQHLSLLLKGEQTSIEKKAYSLAGRRFSFTSSADVSKVIGTYKGKKISTRKQVLEQNEHPISNLVLLWRKINFTLTTAIYPLIRASEENRLYGCYVSHTATGRITMHEPNIQMVTKDFTIVNPLSKRNVLISCRSAFNAPTDYVLVSADYCQLELRILTYLSRDKVLSDIMRKPGDIFKSIAAKWNNTKEEMVDDNMRQNAKQLCYGIIYGMGAKTLADQLEVTIEDAFSFMESFRNTYSGIKDFVKKTVDFCKENGYVETITGRRRLLPNIASPDSSISSQAERQAVNTTVQGSAADIVKNAMITIDEKIDQVFKKSRFKARLVLHLHDELIYEVPEKYIEKTVKVIKTGMENSVSAFGYFPVKVKTGKSWGQLYEYSWPNTTNSLWHGFKGFQFRQRCLNVFTPFYNAGPQVENATYRFMTYEKYINIDNAEDKVNTCAYKTESMNCFPLFGIKVYRLKRLKFSISIYNALFYNSPKSRYSIFPNIISVLRNSRSSGSSTNLRTKFFIYRSTFNTSK